MDDHVPTLTRAKEIGEAVMAKTSAPQVQSELEKADDDYNILHKRLTEAKLVSRDIMGHMEKFRAKTDEVEKKTPKLQEKMENVQPIGTRPQAVKKQVIEADEILKDVKEVVVALECAQEEQDWLLENTDVESELQKEMQETVERFEKPLDEVQSEVKKRQGELQTVLVVSQKFETISEEFTSWLAAVEEEQAKEKTVSAVYDTVKKQQQDHKVGEALSFGQGSYSCSKGD